MEMRRFAVIDIGTVTCRLLVADVADGVLREVAKGYRITNLGEGVDATGLLKPEAMARVAAAVDGFLQTIERVSDGRHVEVCCVATSASRDAANAGEFAAMLAQRGIEVSVIPGAQEAALSFGGASCGLEGQRVLVVDIGGGSTELIAGVAGADPDMAQSFNVGCRRVTEKFMASDPPTALQLDEAYDWASRQFRPFFADMDRRGLAVGRVVAVAGTATSIVSIALGMAEYDASRVHGCEVRRATVDDVYRKVAAAPLADRRRIVGLDPGRAPVMPAGIVILRAVLDAAGADAYTASESDILQGVVLQAAREGTA